MRSLIKPRDLTNTFIEKIRLISLNEFKKRK